MNLEHTLLGGLTILELLGTDGHEPFALSRLKGEPARYDLDVADFEALDMVSMRGLLCVSARWQYRNSLERFAARVREAQGPQQLR